MNTFKPVSVQSAAFIFCRYTIAILIWIAFFSKEKSLILLVFAILLFSAILTVKRAPLIMLYTYTIGKIFKSKTEMLEVKSMRFAHILGTILSLICIIFLYWVNDKVGWILVIVFAVLKTISAFGYCPASKMYSCMMSGGCCALTKR